MINVQALRISRTSALGVSQEASERPSTYKSALTNRQFGRLCRRCSAKPGTLCRNAERSNRHNPRLEYADRDASSIYLDSPPDIYTDISPARAIDPLRSPVGQSLLPAYCRPSRNGTYRGIGSGYKMKLNTHALAWLAFRSQARINGPQTGGRISFSEEVVGSKRYLEAVKKE